MVGYIKFKKGSVVKGQDVYNCLTLLLKFEGDSFYSYETNVIEAFYDNIFIRETVKFLSDKNNIIKAGEDFMKKVLEKENVKKKYKRLLKEFKNDFKIEIKEE